MIIHYFFITYNVYLSHPSGIYRNGNIASTNLYWKRLAAYLTHYIFGEAECKKMATLVYNEVITSLPYDTKARWVINFRNRSVVKKRYFSFAKSQKRYFIVNPTNTEIVYFQSSRSSLPVGRILFCDIENLTLIEDQEIKIIEIELKKNDGRYHIYIEIPENINCYQAKNDFLQVINKGYSMSVSSNTDPNSSGSLQQPSSCVNNNHQVSQENGIDMTGATLASESITQLYFKRLIGQGTYSHVYLAKSNSINKFHIDLFAIKVHVIPFIIDNNQIPKVLNELNILKQLRLQKPYCPFIVKCYKSYRTNCTLNLVLDYHPGQDLHKHVSVNECLSEHAVCYYASQILSALSFLHENRILYRDLVCFTFSFLPENSVLRPQSLTILYIHTYIFLNI